MNISHDDLTNAYRSHLRSLHPPSRSGCPGADELWRLFDRRTREKKKSRLIEHIGRCSDCAVDFLSLLEIRRATADLESRIAGLRVLDAAAAGPLKRRREGTIRGRRRWQFAFLAAGSFIVAAAVLVTLRSDSFSSRMPDASRERLHEEIVLIAPSPGVGMNKDRLFFRWEKPDFVATYVVEIFDTSLARIWRSGLIEGSEAVPPAEVLLGLRGGGRYFWMVTGYDQNGRAFESSLSEFSIRK